MNRSQHINCFKTSLPTEISLGAAPIIWYGHTNHWHLPPGPIAININLAEPQLTYLRDYEVYTL